MLAWAHNETSTGVVVGVERPAGAGDALVLVDATSGAGGLPLDPTQADAYYFAPQKTLRIRRRGLARAAEPGGARADRRARRRTRAAGSPASSRSSSRLENSRKDQTYNTPAVATLLLLADQIDWMLASGGLDWCVGRSRAVLGPPVRVGRALRARDARSSATRPSARRSSARSTSTRASTPSSWPPTLRANGIVDTEPYRKLGRNQLRIGMFPTIDPADVEALTACIDWVLENVEGIAG